MRAIRLTVTGVLTLAALLVCATAGWSQDRPIRRGGAAEAGNPPVLSAAELERWFDSYVLLQAQDTLKLTDAQFARALPPLKALQAGRRKNLQARRQTINAMGALLKATPVDEAALQERLKSLRDLDVKSSDEIRRAYEALDAVLDTTQQARFRLFEEQVERRKIDLLTRARQRASQPPPIK